MYNLLLENVAKSQYADRLEDAEVRRSSASGSQSRLRIKAAYFALAAGGIIWMMLG